MALQYMRTVIKGVPLPLDRKCSLVIQLHHPMKNTYGIHLCDIC